MAAVRSRNTKPEVLVRKLLHSAGFRFRLHDTRMPGEPDMVFPRYKAVIFVHGCFWHGHDCHLFRAPSTRPEFWLGKINVNRRRDQSVLYLLAEKGWRTATIWECALKGKSRLAHQQLIDRCRSWLVADQALMEIRGLAKSAGDISDAKSAHLDGALKPDHLEARVDD